MTIKKESESEDLEMLFIVLGIIIIPFLIYSIYYIIKSEHKIISISTLVIIAGIVIESFKYCEKKNNIFFIAISAFIFSSLYLIPFNGLDDIESNIKVWPYIFIVIFTIISMGYYYSKILPLLTEGITLIQSVVIIYWLFEYNLFATKNPILIVFLGLSLIMTLYSIIHAFFNIKITKGSRLILSIWSAVIMILLGIDNIRDISNSIYIEDSDNVYNIILFTVKYFLFGFSLMYIAINFCLILFFIPTKDKMLNKDYYNDIAELKKNHISRVSDIQTSLILSISSFIISIIFFYLNFNYKFLPKGIAIWLVFFVFGNLFYIYDYIIRIKKYS